VSESKHTPGPWEVGDLDRNSQRIVRGEHIEICTCWHHSVGAIEREMEANARLIAASPELLAGLEHAIYRNHNYSETCDGCKRGIIAVRRAKGEI
jgi:hypothetical protein